MTSSDPDPTPGAATTPPLPAGVRTVTEVVRSPGGVETRVHPGWASRLPWLVQGTTTRGDAADPFDLALFGDGPARRVHARWSALREATGARRVVHGRQVHGAVVRFHREGPPGLHLVDGTDGHVTRSPGTLLTVSVADCVPVFAVHEARRAVALLHAGWRGVVAGIVERGLAALAERLDARASGLHLHLGPAICGRCYEVGPEVHEALGLPLPEAPTPVELRAAVVRRAVDAGVPADRITVSAWCTLCRGMRDDADETAGAEQDASSPFFSHRGGRPERQVAYLGVIPAGGGAG